MEESAGATHQEVSNALVVDLDIVHSDGVVDFSFVFRH